MKVALAAAAAAGAVVGALFARRRGSVETVTREDERAEELRRKLAEAREATADEDDFEAAGMGAETLVEEPPPPVAEPEPKAKPKPKSPARKAPPAAETPETSETPPADEFEAMRRRIHEEGRAAADEMRRSADPPEQT